MLESLIMTIFVLTVQETPLVGASKRSYRCLMLRKEYGTTIKRKIARVRRRRIFAQIVKSGA
ncbi:MAG: hypothetical protein COZ43_00795 [Sphingomonadales bacterium CG_4_10_14_3_um_filter_58_15]|nr:MAG: hypothetical protein COZ43_00795 [Sphingomonadales bacterium CG_4_10_14_3_um_filter_58_15]